MKAGGSQPPSVGYTPPSGVGTWSPLTAMGGSFGYPPPTMPSGGNLQQALMANFQNAMAQQPVWQQQQQTPPQATAPVAAAPQAAPAQPPGPISGVAGGNWMDQAYNNPVGFWGGGG